MIIHEATSFGSETKKHTPVWVLRPILFSKLGSLDPFFSQLVLNMTSDDYTDHIRSLISDDQTFNQSYYGAQWAVDEATSMGTAHVSVIAPDGSAVSVTSTINLQYVLSEPFSLQTQTVKTRRFYVQRVLV